MTTTPRFLQIHTLHSYPAALLNRDDSGLAKRMPFGGATRTRISSQCLKRHWRVADGEFALSDIDGAADAIRSRNVVEREVMKPLRDGSDTAEDVLDAVEDAFNVGVYGSSGTSESGRQPLLLGQPEVEYLQKKAREICAKHSDDAESAGQLATGLTVTDDRIRQASGRAATELRNARKLALKMFGDDEKPNFEAFRKSTELPGGLIGALFGRMVTSDPGANIEAAIHVQHAFTVHREESESDYFSVVDDLQRDDEDAGAAHIGDMELTAGLFYGYVVVDVPGLTSNLSGSRELAGDVVQRLVHLIATVSPGAKLGSTAPYERASMMLVEAGTSQPRTLANAYRSPVKPQMDDAIDAMSKYMNADDDMYGVREVRRFAVRGDYALPEAERLTIPNLANWAADAIRNGEV